MKSNKNRTMNCKEFRDELPDLVLTPGAQPSAAAAAHLNVCPPCTQELQSFADTFAVLDSWALPEPSPYFDQRLAVKLREEQMAPRMGWWEKLRTRVTLNTGAQFRPAMAGALALALVAAGGGLGYDLSSHSATPVQASTTVQDLQILDRNAQAFEQLDVLQQDDDTPAQPGDTAAAPTS